MLDVVALLAVMTILIAALAVPFINEPPKDVAEKRAPTEPVPFYVELRWEYGQPHDVDTWVQCVIVRPDGVKSVYTVSYRQRHAGFLDLVWDDLGSPSPVNFERVVSNSNVQKMPPNTFCRINAHLYSSHGGMMPVKGDLTVILDKDAPTEELLTPEKGLPFSIVYKGEEVTLFELAWDERGQLIQGAIAMYPNVPLSCLATSICGKK
ncbi:hypothetical protein COU20_03875 [Candidatus Kaiserbacteria bacterium CG10_big_fil_rev_8_21_14_0_10_59_10]|uniref:Uncharacterized protein n=1 Tax=Candidatus Kaiserbacteria bacterium CG10_big_fil_rev_8_21_14_0_10_59_10 TaxID=1974612 RepID=A0A2H0U769_9BACT|nr:MAG: hypothetical protein COU20_03875 [Candidatus Kaiserbacteria bacterium CG10_big_fil_rev_8_21_14_0_10_59_10]